MVQVHDKSSTVSLPMNGGDDRYSYVKNSNLQRSGFNATKGILEEAIAEKLNIQNLHNNTKTLDLLPTIWVLFPCPYGYCVSSSAWELATTLVDVFQLSMPKQCNDPLDLSKKKKNTKTFTIADFGCSVGPNAFNAVHAIIDAVEKKYKSEGLSSQIHEYQVFFSDNITNDFNTLFQSLPLERNYYVVGAPGSFYTRLFPQASLHFVHSSFALQWLSKVPPEVVDINSLAWNKGSITFENAHEEMVKAYSAQHVKDLEIFLSVRAEEIVVGGLMALLLPIIPSGSPSQARGGYYHLDKLGSCLMDMADMGMINEAIVDSFNLPEYISSPQEVIATVETNKCFSIEKIEELCPGIEELSIVNNAETYAMHMRAVFEGIIKEQFGSEIIDELFDRYSKKLEDSISNSKLGTYNKLFVLLKHN